MFDLNKVKEEPWLEPSGDFETQAELQVKEEPVYMGVSVAAARAGLYSGHAVQGELVVGPECLQLRDVAYTIRASTLDPEVIKEKVDVKQEAPRIQISVKDCFVRLVRIAVTLASNEDRGSENHRSSLAHIEDTLESEDGSVSGVTFECAICKERFTQRTCLVKHETTHVHIELGGQDVHVASTLDPKVIEEKVDVRQEAPRLQISVKDCFVRLVRIAVPLASNEDRGSENHRSVGGDTFECAICKELFTQKTCLVKHETTHVHIEQGGQDVHVDTRRTEDIRVHTKDKRYACEICSKKFSRLPYLQRHALVHTNVRKYSCDVCKRQYKHKSELTRHMRIHSGENTYVCGICNKQFTDSASLKNHERIHSGEKPYVCGMCNKQFRLSHSLKTHERIHSGEKPYVCGICNKQFTVSESLKNHERIHSGDKPYVCGICNKQFRLSTFLKMHQRIHSGEKPYVCGICNKQFRLSAFLKVHQRVHSGEKPYMCGICNKQFRESRSLKIHETKHSGKKPFSCKVCMKEFGDPASFRRHKFLHTGEKPHACGVCDKKFAQFSYLKQHKLVHSTAKPHSCGVCKQRFKSLAGLRNHQLIHEGLKPHKPISVKDRLA